MFYVHPLYPDLTVFFINDPPTPNIYTLSLHDALPISAGDNERPRIQPFIIDFDSDMLVARIEIGHFRVGKPGDKHIRIDRKSTRLNSSHTVISYAVFCLKKKKQYSRSSDMQHQHDMYV